MPMIPTPCPAMWPYGRIKPGKNSREIVVDDGIRELHQSIVRIGQLEPLLVTDQETDNLIAGFRRYAAMGLGGIESVSVLVYPPSLTTTQRCIITATENLQRVDLTDPEIFLTCKELMTLNPDWQRKDLAAHLNKDASTVTRYLSPLDLVPEALEAFLAGKFGFSKAYSIAKSTDQLATLAMALSGETRDEMDRKIRQKRSSGDPAVRTSRIKCPLSTGHVVTVAGDGVSLEDAIESLQTAIKAIKKAIDTGLDAKTAQAVWRDMAKAG